MRKGVRLGVDPGLARIGVAICDPSGVLATPLVTLGADGNWITDLVQLSNENQIIEIIFGLPKSLAGIEGAAAKANRELAAALANQVAPIPVRLFDERLTTVVAHAQLRAAGRKTKKHRKVIDQAAAVQILQQALDMERNLGCPVGELVII